MAATINTNIASINAQRNLSLSGQSLNTTMQRLSSGLRVNSAKDDAAGLAIAERMNTQVKGLTVASRNANDGISLAQTAEGALGKVGDMLQRMRELAVQASNATNSASDREALQAEVGQLAAEIDRVAKQTNFNGQKILDGSFAGAVFQVGANSGDNVTLGALADTRASKLSVVNFAQNTVEGINTNDTPTAAIVDYNKAIPAGQLKITVQTSPAVEIPLESIKEASSSLERIGQVVTAINNKAADTGVTAYMSRDENSGLYQIQLMAAKTDATGKPYDVEFTGFTQATTGVGKPTALNSILSADALSAPTPITTDWSTGAPTDTGTATAKPSPASATAAEAYADELRNIAALIAEPAKTELLDKLTAYENAVDAWDAITTYPNPQTTTEVDLWAAMENTFSDLQAFDPTASLATYNATLPVAVDDVIANSPLATALSSTSPDTDFPAAVAQLVANNPGLDLSAFDVAQFTQADPADSSLTIWKDAPDGVDAALTNLNDLISKQLTGDLNVNTIDHKVNERGLDVIDVRTQEGAWIALKKIDSAIDQVNSSRATLGAMQTRFENAVNNIDIQVENLSAARGRIMDADFAVETSNLSRTQILQQAGTAMVAQANQIPQNVLQLLQG